MIDDYDNEDYDYFKEWDIEQYKKEIERLHSIIKEVRELVENDIDFKCITFKKVDEDTWKLILASHIKEDFLQILDKEVRLW